MLHSGIQAMSDIQGNGHRCFRTSCMLCVSDQELALVKQRVCLQRITSKTRLLSPYFKWKVRQICEPKLPIVQLIVHYITLAKRKRATSPATDDRPSPLSVLK